METITTYAAVGLARGALAIQVMQSMRSDAAVVFDIASQRDARRGRGFESGAVPPRPRFPRDRDG